MKKTILLLATAFYGLTVQSQGLPSYVPDSLLVAWYSFNGNSNDLSGNDYTLTNYNATLTEDRCGNANSAYYFNGDSAFLISNDSLFNNGWPYFTISLWFETDSVVNPQNIHNAQTMFNTNPHYGSELSLSYGGVFDNVYFFYETTPSQYNIWDVFGYGYPNTALSQYNTIAHQWTHVAMVKADTVYTMYVNGAYDTSFVNTDTAINYNCQVVIGDISGPYPAETFYGSLDDYGFWSRALSPGEILQLYHTNCKPTGINQVTPQVPVAELYPNPAQDYTHILCNTAQPGTPWFITDVTGRQVSAGTLTDYNTIINTAGLSPGLYFVHMGLSNVSALRFVKE